jgi:hypothetical protein
VAGILITGGLSVEGVVTYTLGSVSFSGFTAAFAVALVVAPSLALAGDLTGERGSGTTLSVLTMAF